MLMPEAFESTSKPEVTEGGAVTKIWVEAVRSIAFVSSPLK